MHRPSFLARERASPNSGQAFLVRQSSLVFTEHFTIENDSSPYVTYCSQEQPMESHVSHSYFGGTNEEGSPAPFMYW